MSIASKTAMTTSEAPNASRKTYRLIKLNA
jgi:hypothetical protein